MTKINSKRSERVMRLDSNLDLWFKSLKINPFQDIDINCLLTNKLVEQQLVLPLKKLPSNIGHKLSDIKSVHMQTIWLLSSR